MHEASVSVRPASILALKRRICHEWIRACDDPEAGYGGEARGSSALCACMDCIHGKGLETCLSEISDTITRLSLILPCDIPMLEAFCLFTIFFPGYLFVCYRYKKSLYSVGRDDSPASSPRIHVVHGQTAPRNPARS